MIRNKRKEILLAAAAAAIVLVCMWKPGARDTSDTGKTADTQNMSGTQGVQDSAVIAAASGAVIDMSDYPPSLLDFMEKYPEAEQFVTEYPLYKDQKLDMSISADLADGGFPLFLQWDKRWGYETYGDDFMAVNGCGPTCLSMVYSGLSQKTDWNPYQVARMAERNNYFVDGVGSSWELMNAGAKKMGLDVTEIGVDAEAIFASLDEGKPVICSVGPGDFTYEGHFIVLAGINEDGSIQVLDPNSRINSEKSWEFDTLFSQIVGAWSYSYQAPLRIKKP